MTSAPLPYHARVSTWWWARSWAYFKFILRELSSVPVAVFVLLTLAELRALSAGPAAWAELQEWLRRPLVILASLAVLAAVVFHAVTWFRLVPATMVLRIGGKRVPGWLLAGAHFAAWGVASVLVAWFLLGA